MVKFWETAGGYCRDFAAAKAAALDAWHSTSVSDRAYTVDVERRRDDARRAMSRCGKSGAPSFPNNTKAP